MKCSAEGFAHELTIVTRSWLYPCHRSSLGELPRPDLIRTSPRLERTVQQPHHFTPDNIMTS